MNASAHETAPRDRLKLIVGDITDPPPDLHIDTIVNAANESLLGGGGVDGAIHRAAGPDLKAHNKTLGRCPTGSAKMTAAFNLQPKGINHIIHTVGPVWHGQDTAKLGDTREDNLLANCYTRSLQLAAEHDCQVVAFPAISTGIYHFPKLRAAKIAYSHILGHLKANDLPRTVVLCCYSEADAKVYREAIDTSDQWLTAAPSDS